MVAVSYHDLGMVSSMAFLDNSNTIMFMESGVNATLKTCRITRNNSNGQIVLTEPEMMAAMLGPESTTSIDWQMAYSGEQKGIVAFASDSIARAITFYDTRRDASNHRRVHGGVNFVHDLAFPHDGNRLAVTYNMKTLCGGIQM